MKNKILCVYLLACNSALASDIYVRIEDDIKIVNINYTIKTSNNVSYGLSSENFMIKNTHPKTYGGLYITKNSFTFKILKGNIKTRYILDYYKQF